MNANQFTPTDEKVHNSFLRAIRSGGILERAVLHRRPFDAVFVPKQKRLEELQLTALLESKPNPNYAMSIYDEETGGVPASARAQLIHEGDGLLDPAVVLRIPHPDPKTRELLALFLEHHIGSFDSLGLAPTFSLMCGLRGTISEFLDSIGVAGRLTKVPIAAHLTPTVSVNQSDPKLCPPTTDPDTLNIFLLEDTILEPYDLRKYLSQIQSSQQELKKSETIAMEQDNSKLSRFINDLFGNGVQAPPVSSTATEAPEAQLVQSNFQKFQEKMQRPESKYLARSVTAFIEYCNGTSSISSAAHNSASGGSSAMGVANRSKPISPREVQSVIDQLMAQVASLKEWKGMENMALEGFEKYIMTKIYKRTFCYTEMEKTETAKFKNRLTAFAAHVSEQSFELLPMVTECPQWRQAVVELNAMADYKCPRDKLVCGTNACRLVIRALEVAAEQKKKGEAFSPKDRESELVAHNSPVPSSVGTADVFLPALFLCVARANPTLYLANIRFIDRYRHRSLLDNEAGYLLTCLLSVIEFWQSATHEQLGITEESYAAALATEKELNHRVNEDKAPTQNDDNRTQLRDNNTSQQPVNASPAVSTSSHVDPLDAYFSSKPAVVDSTPTSNVKKVDEIPKPISSDPVSSAHSPEPQNSFPTLITEMVSRSLVRSPTEEAFAKLEAAEGCIDCLTISELRLVAAEALKIWKTRPQK